MSQAEIDDLQACLEDEGVRIAKRIRAVFLLKQIGEKYPAAAINALSVGLATKSVLLSHETGYVLGQMGNPLAVPYLTAALENISYDPITRHEAAEALSAIGQEASLPILQKYCSDASEEVAETCKLAVEGLQFKLAKKGEGKGLPIGQACVNEVQGDVAFGTLDPAPPLNSTEEGPITIAKLQSILNNTGLSLFKRYRAMFTLRNINTAEAVHALCSGFADQSALFKHEIAYVLGQMQNPASSQALQVVLQDASQHEMVRHEAAEALGSIGGDLEEEQESEEGKVISQLLQKYQQSENQIIRESCDVALDIQEYWQGEEIETATCN